MYGVRIIRNSTVYLAEALGGFTPVLQLLHNMESGNKATREDVNQPLVFCL